MIFGEPYASTSFTQAQRYRHRITLRRGELFNLAAKLPFIPLWLLLCFIVTGFLGSQWLWLPALLNLYLALGLYRRYRLIADTPVSRISSSAQGYVGLRGRAWLPEGEAFRGAPHLPVMLWLPGQIEDQPFYIADDVGRCLLYPQQAEIVPQAATHHLHSLQAIYPGQMLYVLGDMHTLAGDNLQVCYREQVSQLLAEWKSRPDDLIAHFDQNDNGKLDTEEWQQVVQSAQRLTHEDIQHQRSKPGMHVIDHSLGGRLFMITNIPPDKLARRYRISSLIHSLAWFGLLMAAL